MLSEPVVALWAQGAFLGAMAALQGKQWQFEGELRTRSSVFGTELTTPCPLLAYPPNDGACFLQTHGVSNLWRAPLPDSRWRSLSTAGNETGTQESSN